jgi:hypothetical protein
MLRECITPEIGVGSVEEIHARAREIRRRLAGDRRVLVPRDRVRPPEPETPPPAKPKMKPKPTPPDLIHLPPRLFPLERMRDICQVVADAHGVTVEEIMSHTRQTHIAVARHVAIYLCAREQLNLSLKQLGDFFRRDHTTIHHAVTLLDRKYGTDVTGARREARCG